MSIPRTVIGTALDPFTAVVERGRLRFFADATGQADSVYRDVDAAKAAGHPDLPAAPTFLFGLKLDAPEPFGWILGLGVDLRMILHGTQKFEYHSLAYAGDSLTFTATISDLFEKRGGALEFIVLETAVTRGSEPVATLVETIVVQHPELAVAA